MQNMQVSSFARILARTDGKTWHTSWRNRYKLSTPLCQISSCLIRNHFGIFYPATASIKSQLQLTALKQVKKRNLSNMMWWNDTLWYNMIRWNTHTLQWDVTKYRLKMALFPLANFFLKGWYPYSNNAQMKTGCWTCSYMLLFCRFIILRICVLLPWQYQNCLSSCH